jgi:hypothetical protein
MAYPVLLVQKGREKGMTDYTELFEALRHCAGDIHNCQSGCKYAEKGSMYCHGFLQLDAADAIEALQAEVERLTTENKELAADRPEMVEADGHWEWRKPNGEVLMPKRGEWILTNDEIETIRIHMNAIKEQLCNQYRHREAEAYQTIVDKLAKMEAQE